MILTAIQNPQPDYVALAMVLVLAVIVAIMAIRKRVRTKTKPSAPAVNTAATPTEAQELPAAPGSAGQVKLHNVEPKTAAMLMAIVANKMDRPLNELRFISIKEVE